LKSFPGRSVRATWSKWYEIANPPPEARPSRQSSYKFTPTEDQKLVELRAKGLEWLEIQNQMPERTFHALKNRFYHHLRRRIQH